MDVAFRCRAVGKEGNTALLPDAVYVEFEAGI